MSRRPAHALAAALALVLGSGALDVPGSGSPAPPSPVVAEAAAAAEAARLVSLLPQPEPAAPAVPVELPTTTTSSTTTTAPPPSTTTSTSTPPSTVPSSARSGSCGGWAELIAAHFPAEQHGTACRVMLCESGGNPAAKNPRSTASGLWQFLDGTWSSTTGLAPPARSYSPDQQTAAAAALWRSSGWRPWSCY